jgi:Winged helix-turn helix
MWTSSAALVITPESRLELERIVRSGKTEQRIGLRARIVLGAADGKSNNALAKELKTSRPTVLDWRQRFAEGGVKALYDDRPARAEFQAVGSHQASRGYCAGHTMELPQHGLAKHRCSASGTPT